jgi:glycine/D-amino acid oxidase-like deaminating enzyme
MTPHVVIVGGGFGGLYAARALKRAPLRVTLIDRRNHHLFQPLLYQVANAVLSPADIAAPIRHILRRQRNASVLLAEVADVDAIAAAARDVGAITVADGTQACGWLSVDASRLDALAVGAYKWLLSPRGTGFLVTTPRLREWIVPSQAGWSAGEDPHASYYGPPLRLASDARRLDISPRGSTGWPRHLRSSLSNKSESRRSTLTTSRWRTGSGRG